MSHHDLTRVDAAARTAALTLNAADVELDLTGACDQHQRTFGVHVTWDFSLNDDAPTTSTFLDFIGDVHAVEINGVALGRTELSEVVSDGRIELHGLQATNRVVVEGAGYYSRSGEGLHRYVDPEDGQTYLYTQYEPTDARRVVPCFDQPDLRTAWTSTVLAPEGWSVSSNALPVGQPVRQPVTGETQAGIRHEFAPTASIPSYLTTVLAGPYHRVDSTWSRKYAHRPQQLPLTLWCRASMAQYLPAEELFDLTRTGLDFFTELFDLPFPFDSYEQAFVPEYNLGAMENPGMVTLTEDYLFPDGPTHQQRAGRANTVLHEMAHMYFGDLVTIRWWEDLWLKESFAEFMGAYASAEATEFRNAWAGFAVRRKGWAYRQDSLSTTHPVVADVPDVAAARQNFDGITYAKGAATLKQLVAYVGVEEFMAACRVYFRRHAWGSADLQDFLAALEEVSSRDTAAWARDWLGTLGTTVMDADIRESGLHLTLRGTLQDPASQRAHHLAVGLYEPGSDTPGLERRHQMPVDLPADLTPGTALVIPLPPAAGSRAPLVLVNDDDLDFSHVNLDPATTQRLMEDLGALPNPMARSVAWSHLWSMLRRAQLDPADFLGAVTRHVFAETESVVFETILERAVETVEDYVPVRRRADQRRVLTNAVVHHLKAAQPGSDRQTALARILGRLVARDPGPAAWLRDLLTGRQTLEGLILGPSLRWRWMTGLVASNHAVDSWVREELERDGSRVSQIGHARTQAARPTQWAKDAAWEQMLGGDLSNDLLSATAAGFQLADDHLITPYRDAYFAMLMQQWETRSMGMATRVVAGLYPSTCDLEPGGSTESDSLLSQTQQWLDTHPQAPAALRRVVTEQRDERLIRLRIQARSTP